MLKINFLGDSITEMYLASRYENCFVYLVGKMLNAETRNYGIAGTRIAKNINPSPKAIYDQYFASRVDSMNHDADLVFVFGGVNDFGHGDAPLGEYGDKTPDTFYGAMDDLVNELLKYYDKEKIIFIMPLYYENEYCPSGFGSSIVPRRPLPEYRKAIKEVIEEYDIKLLDIKDKIGPAKNNPLIEDGLHPNDAGHKLIAELLVDYIKSSDL